MDQAEAEYRLNAALTSLDAKPLHLSIVQRIKHPARWWHARRWSEWCRCGLCQHRYRGVRNQYIAEGRHCACGYCPLWAPYPTCAVKEWQHSLG